MNIALLGYGVVGKGVYEIIKAHPEYGVCVKKVLMSRPEKCTEDYMTTNYDEIINDESIEVVCEAIGGLEPAGTYAKKALASGKHFVSANKKMLAHNYQELAKLAAENDVLVRFASAAGGGIPWLEQLSVIKSREDVSKFEGIMNGTSNYILDKMDSENMSFAVALKKAQELGYAEADPSDDIDGVDTANKTVLSANLAFEGVFDVDDMLIKGIRYISDAESKFAKDNGLKAILRGYGMKKDGKCAVAVYPYFEKLGKVISAVKVNYNCFVLESENLGPVTFVGQGAGRFPTASNVVADVLKIKAGQGFKVGGAPKENADEIIEDCFYVRTTDASAFDAFEKEAVADGAFLINTNVKALRQALNNCQDKEVFIAGVDK